MPYISGLASGLNTEELISQLMAIERRPVLLLQQKQSTLQLRADAWKDINSRLATLDSKLSDLMLTASFNTKKVSSTNEAVATATATAAATVSSYDLQVTQLAKAHRIASDRQADTTSDLNLAGDVKINGTTISITADMSLTDIKDAINQADAGVTASIIDSTLILESTKTGVANEIELVDDNNVLSSLGLVKVSSNLASGATVTASSSRNGNPASNVIDGNLSSSWVDNTRNMFPDTLTLEFGSGQRMNQLKIYTPTTGDGLRDFTVEYIDANGNRATLATVSNNTSGTITLDFAEPVDVKQVIITVNNSHSGSRSEIFEVQAFDTNAVKNELQAAQDAQFSVNGVSVTRGTNTVSDVVDGVTFQLKGTGSTTITVDRDIDYATDKIRALVDQYNSTLSLISGKAAKGAILQGDSTLIRLQTGLRSAVTDPVAVPPDNDYDQLALVGITVDKTGVMTLDESKLRKALETNPEAVEQLFKATAEDDGFDGVVARARAYIEPYIEAGTGILPSRQKAFERQINDVKESIEAYERRLELREQSLVRQFTALETALSSFQNQSLWLAGQLSQLGSFTGIQANG